MCTAFHKAVAEIEKQGGNNICKKKRGEKKTLPLYSLHFNVTIHMSLILLFVFIVVYTVDKRIALISTLSHWLFLWSIKSLLKSLHLPSFLCTKAQNNLKAVWCPAAEDPGGRRIHAVSLKVAHLICENCA